jgi:hypothetical protein
MKRFIATVLVLMGLVSGSCAQEKISMPYGKDLFFSRGKGSRSLWIWNTIDILRKPGERDALLQFIKKPHGTDPEINNLYFNANVNFLRSEKLREAFIDLIVRAHKQGVTVQYLAGHAAWAYQNREVLGIIEAVSEFNASLSPEQRLDGVHFDIEPHTLPMWNSDSRLKQRFFQSIKLYGERMRELNPDIVFGIDVPTFWNKDEIRLLAESTDYITLMNYTDNGVFKYKRAKKFLEVADEMGTKIETGVETQGPSEKWGVTPPITFYDEGRELMEARLAHTEKLMGVHESYIGIAIHYYDSYKNFQKERKIIKDTETYPDQPLITIPFLTVPIAVDGKLTEVPDNDGVIALDDSKYVVYEIAPKSWEGLDDFSVIAYIGWTETDLYLGFDVKDDSIVQPFSGEDMVNGDHLELWFDTDYEGDEWQNWISEDDFQLGFSPGNFKDVAPSICLWAPALENVSTLSMIEYSSVKTETGYRAEMKIPFEFFSGMKPVDGTRIRLNIDPSDSDGPNDVQEVLLSSSICRRYGNPRSFRTAIFKRAQ